MTKAGEAMLGDTLIVFLEVAVSLVLAIGLLWLTAEVLVYVASLIGGHGRGET